MTGYYIMGEKSFYDILTCCKDMMTVNWKAVSATWQGDLNFVGEIADGGTVHMGATGNSSGIGPMQLILIGLSGCTGIDIVSILQKKKVVLVNFKVMCVASANLPPLWFIQILK